MTGDIVFTDWRTASLSFSNGNCAEVGTWRHGVAVRDTKDRSGPVLAFPGTTWGRFLAAVRQGEGCASGTLAP